jgi:hypothetical protein
MTVKKVGKKRVSGSVTFNVTKIVVHLTRFGADEIYIYTNHPSPIAFETSLCLTAKVAKNCGIKYVLDNFDIQPEVLNTRN